MFPIEVFRETVEKLLAILRELEVPFHLTGGITSAAWSEPRMTQDVDIVVGPKRLQAELDRFMVALADSDFFFPADEVRRAVQAEEMFQLMDGRESLKLDIYPTEMIKGELERSTQYEVFRAGEELPIASREDMVVAKLVWISKGSHKSRHDVRALYSETDARQQAFIAKHAEEFGLTDLLAEVLAEPDEIR